MMKIIFLFFYQSYNARYNMAVGLLYADKSKGLLSGFLAMVDRSLPCVTRSGRSTALVRVRRSFRHVVTSMRAMAEYSFVSICYMCKQTSLSICSQKYYFF